MLFRSSRYMRSFLFQPVSAVSYFVSLHSRLSKFVGERPKQHNGSPHRLTNRSGPFHSRRRHARLLPLRQHHRPSQPPRPLRQTHRPHLPLLQLPTIEWRHGHEYPHRTHVQPNLHRRKALSQDLYRHQHRQRQHRRKILLLELRKFDWMSTCPLRAALVDGGNGLVSQDSGAGV